MSSFIGIKVVRVDDAFIEEFRKGRAQAAAALQVPAPEQLPAAKRTAATAAEELTDDELMAYFAAEDDALPSNPE